jgi:hypothetical protein
MNGVVDYEIAEHDELWKEDGISLEPGDAVPEQLDKWEKARDSWKKRNNEIADVKAKLAEKSWGLRLFSHFHRVLEAAWTNSNQKHSSAVAAVCKNRDGPAKKAYENAIDKQGGVKKGLAARDLEKTSEAIKHIRDDIVEALKTWQTSNGCVEKGLSGLAGEVSVYLQWENATNELWTVLLDKNNSNEPDAIKSWVKRLQKTEKELSALKEKGLELPWWGNEIRNHFHEILRQKFASTFTFNFKQIITTAVNEAISLPPKENFKTMTWPETFEKMKAEREKFSDVMKAVEDLVSGAQADGDTSKAAELDSMLREIKEYRKVDLDKLWNPDGKKDHDESFRQKTDEFMEKLKKGEDPRKEAARNNKARTGWLHLWKKRQPTWKKRTEEIEQAKEKLKDHWGFELFDHFHNVLLTVWKDAEQNYPLAEISFPILVERPALTELLNPRAIFIGNDLDDVSEEHLQKIWGKFKVEHCSDTLKLDRKKCDAIKEKLKGTLDQRPGVIARKKAAGTTQQAVREKQIAETQKKGAEGQKKIAEDQQARARRALKATPEEVAALQGVNSAKQDQESAATQKKGAEGQKTNAAVQQARATKALRFLKATPEERDALQGVNSAKQDQESAERQSKYAEEEQTHAESQKEQAASTLAASEEVKRNQAPPGGSGGSNTNSHNTQQQSDTEGEDSGEDASDSESEEDGAKDDSNGNLTPFEIVVI